MIFPSWYEGGFADAEDVVCRLLMPHYAACNPQPQVLVYLPENYDSPTPIVRVARVGGAVSEESGGVKDVTTIQVATMATNRRVAFELSEFTRQVLLAHGREGSVVDMGGGKKVWVSSITDARGPQVLPELQPNVRLVINTYSVWIKRTTGADYVPFI